jgi:hypothetical protein
MIPENAINLPPKRPHQFKTLAPLDNENRWAGTNLSAGAAIARPVHQMQKVNRYAICDAS